MEEASTPSPTTTKLGTVLVVDDQPANRELLAGYLASIPCRVQQAADGEQALASVAADPPDLLLLDVMMPALDGYAVAQRLKQDPRTATIPVVLVTALDGMNDMRQGMEIGADEFLTKPVDRRELVARVRPLLGLEQQRREWEARLNSI